mmetsp:Transcript_90622/g.233918  ORF Transcript_90622/g.233918 Transcript_90622/m.233918 type:complete len:741 (-) Transcript_90622:36-2258(-)
MASPAAAGPAAAVSPEAVAQETGAADEAPIEQQVAGLATLPDLKTPAEWPWKPLPSAAAPPGEEGDAAAAAGAAAATPVAALAAAAESAGEAREGGDGDGGLSYEQNMWDRFELIWSSRIEPSHRLLEQVTDVLSKRAELERKYGDSLVSFAGEVKTDSQANSVHAAVESVMVNFKNRAEQSIELADSIEQDIVAAFEVVIQQHKAVARHVYNDLQLLVRYCQEKRHLHDKMARRYASRCLEAEQAAQECLQGLAMKTVDRMKLAMQATKLSKQARVAEHEYYAAISQANQAQSVYDAQIPYILSAVQDMDEKRGKCLTDGLMKLAVFETSWLRNLQYDLEATVKAGESCDAAKDVQDFIRENQSPSKEGRSVPLAARGFWTLKHFKEQPKMTPGTRNNMEVQQYIRQLMDAELRDTLAALLAEDAPGSKAEECKEQLEQVRAGANDPRRRAALCQVLRSEVLKREAAGTELDNASGISVPLPILDALVQMFKASLDHCDEQHDSWCGRDFMVLAQKFRTEADGGKPVSLLSRIYNHALWNKVTFWEETLVLGLCEAHSAEAVWRRSVTPGSQFTQPAMTAFLQHFVGYMMAFGISFDQGRNSVQATLKKHSAMLGGTVKPYATLLLQPYESQAAPAPAQGAAAAVPARQLSVEAEDGKSAAGSSAVGGGDSSNMAADMEDDFEAMAFGLPPDSSKDAASTTDAAGADDSGEDAEPEDSPGADALRALGGTQPSVDDVFA